MKKICDMPAWCMVIIILNVNTVSVCNMHVMTDYELDESESLIEIVRANFAMCMKKRHFLFLARILFSRI